MTVYLNDYQAPDYTINHIDLKFELDDTATVVTANLIIEKKNLSSEASLVLDGGDFELLSISLNGVPLSNSEYTIANNQLTLHTPPSSKFTLTIATQINPKENTALEGLYKTGELFTTHCEAEGFRNITYFLDRPDVLATYTTEIHGDKEKHPVLLANGNLSYSGINPNDPTKHMAIYHDPIPKPSYLYALVAGNLGLNEDYFTTRSGKRVTLRIYVPEEDLPKTAHAMEALKAAMRFDEEHYDREYDLSVYNIVGVPQFNAGAMENKGLNIFNNSSLLVDPKSATDSDFEWVYSVVGHEYFHNWRGNRVTVKQWHELSLKEGFATVTEQEFAQTLFQSQVSRIGDIDTLRSSQFSRDSGPLAQAVRPAEYETTSNLYTSTIYLKGAELLNMLKNFLGQENFKKGCTIYFDKNDGKAVDIEAFLAAMEEASGRGLSQFLTWYEQEGTPQLHFEEEYDEQAQTYTLIVKQTCPPTPNQPQKKPLPIPIAVGLLGPNGQEIPLKLEGEAISEGTTCVLELNQPTGRFKFIGIKEKPVPSLMRNFSAPVNIVHSPVTDTELKFLLKHDSDPVNRWLAGSTLAKNAILNILADMKAGKKPTLDLDLIDAYRAILVHKTMELRLITEILRFPSVSSFFEYVKPINPDLIQAARDFFIKGFIEHCYEELKLTYVFYSKLPESDKYNPTYAGMRSLRNLCLSFLMISNTAEANEFCLQQLTSSCNMTDTLGALSPLTRVPSQDRKELQRKELDAFKDKWQHDAVTIEHLFKLYALSEWPDAFDQIKLLMNSSCFQKENPSHVSALLGVFYKWNPCRFHDTSGRVYEFFADSIIELDQINSETAADLVPAFECWQKMEPVRQEKMLEQLFRLHALPMRPKDSNMEMPGVTYLSSEVKELVDKNMKNALEAKATSANNPHRWFATEEKEQKEEYVDLEKANVLN